MVSHGTGRQRAGRGRDGKEEQNKRAKGKTKYYTITLEIKTVPNGILADGWYEQSCPVGHHWTANKHILEEAKFKDEL